MIFTGVPSAVTELPESQRVSSIPSTYGAEIKDDSARVAEDTPRMTFEATMLLAACLVCSVLGLSAYLGILEELDR